MSNEAIVLNSGTLDEIGHTPEKIYEWMHKNTSSLLGTLSYVIEQT